MLRARLTFARFTWSVLLGSLPEWLVGLTPLWELIPSHCLAPHPMAVHPTDAAAAGLGVHGLRFLNDEWNDSISNGDSFTLRWNQSLARLGSGLGAFKVTYPKDGVVVYELVSNLTGV